MKNVYQIIDVVIHLKHIIKLVHIGIGGPVKEIVLDEEYFLESIEKPFAKIVKGSIPGMAPLPTTEEERKAIMAYVKSLDKDE